MKSRSSWLKNTEEYAKLGKKSSGRKYFRIHKNHQSPDSSINKLSPMSTLNRSELKPRLNESISMTPKPSPLSKGPLVKYIEDPILSQKLLEKDIEIKILRNLFNETSRKLKSVERFKPEKESFKNQIFPELKSLRNKSTVNCKVDNFSEAFSNHAFMQPRYPKQRPKVYFGNPITGIPTFMPSSPTRLL